MRYASAGDFEGHLTYGLGIWNPGHPGLGLPVRAGELRRSDRAGGELYAVFLDVRTA